MIEFTRAETIQTEKGLTFEDKGNKVCIFDVGDVRFIEAVAPNVTNIVLQGANRPVFGSYEEVKLKIHRAHSPLRSV